ncbi:hypothetical protein BB560_004571 [Smittium megazygosporum]|uniref:Uncharacterized protein n=1 Tax=Smittium megazygosporum TaxID=133381 RepID=A0A2T9Z923_9FUNG|nr:hypothetical protein BB560_004571 [Smittium megazygosporum]
MIFFMDIHRDVVVENSNLKNSYHLMSIPDSRKSAAHFPFYLKAPISNHASVLSPNIALNSFFPQPFISQSGSFAHSFFPALYNHFGENPSLKNKKQAFLSFSCPDFRPVPAILPSSLILHCESQSTLDLTGAESLLEDRQIIFISDLNEMEQSRHLPTQLDSKSLYSNPLPSNQIAAWKVSVAGMSAGFISSIAICPLDVAKTRLQYQAVIKSRGMVQYHGTIATLQRIYREESIPGLYRGLKPMLLGYLPTWAMYFTMYEYTKSLFSNSQTLSSFSYLSQVCSSMIAGITTTTQNQYTDYKYNSILGALKTIIKEEGIKGFYKGMGISLTKTNSDHSDPKDHKPINILLASALSKMIASTVTYPHEVIRTRLQNQVKPPFEYKGIVDAFFKIAKQEGLVGFYQGLSVNLIRAVPNAMITLFSFEIVLKLL